LTAFDAIGALGITFYVRAANNDTTIAAQSNGRGSAFKDDLVLGDNAHSAAVNRRLDRLRSDASSASVIAGWSESEVMNQVLTKACENKDLSRAGIVNALHEIDNLDTGGLVAAPLDFTQVGQPATKVIYVAMPDKTAVGGAKVVGGPYESSTAKAYSGA